MYRYILTITVATAIQLPNLNGTSIQSKLKEAEEIVEHYKELDRTHRGYVCDEYDRAKQLLRKALEEAKKLGITEEDMTKLKNLRSYYPEYC